MAVKVSERAKKLLDSRNEDPFPVRTALWRFKSLLSLKVNKENLRLVRKRDGLTYEVLNYSYKTGKVTLRQVGWSGVFESKYGIHMEISYNAHWYAK